MFSTVSSFLTLFAFILSAGIWFFIYSKVFKHVIIIANPIYFIIPWALTAVMLVGVKAHFELDILYRIIDKESCQIQGSYETDDGIVGIKTRNDDGSLAKNNHDCTYDGFFYDEEGEEILDVIFSPKKHLAYVWSYNPKNNTKYTAPGKYEFINKTGVLEIKLEDGRYFILTKIDPDWKSYIDIDSLNTEQSE